MGITIHYGGRVASEAAIDALYDEAIAIAGDCGWQAQLPADGDRRTGGLRLLPHADCEPVLLHFTRTRRFRDFCKTQFAGPRVHRQVLDLFERLSPYFSQLLVHDEAQEFEPGDDDAAWQEVFDRELDYIREGLVEYPGSRMQVRLPSGRIADLMT